MPLSQKPELVSFDAESGLQAGQDVAGDTLLTCIEYTDDDWRAIYVADQVLAMYENHEHMAAHFQTIYEEHHIDASERDLLERELASMGSVRYFVTQMDMAVFARVVTRTATHDLEGLWLTYAPGAPLIESLDAVTEHVSGTIDPDPPYEP
ncbi:MAG: hypothetical protein ABEI77_03135 [Halorientalis sp.]